VDPEALRSTIELTDREIADYYEENPDDFSQEEQVHARHILLRVDTDRSAAQAEQQMEVIRQRLAAGEDFSALALELSDDPGSKTQGGDLGFFGRGQMIPEFETAAFEAEPGDLVGPVQTSFGYHLIEVLDKQPAGRKSLEEATEEIRTLLLSERTRTAAEAKAHELAEKIGRDKIDSAAALRALAESEPGVTFHSTEPFRLDDDVPGIGKKTAERMVVDLRDKVQALADELEMPVVVDETEADLVQALVNLGYKETLAQRAVLQAKQENPQAPFHELLRLSLQRLAGV
jgi:hypothetical protein